MKWALYNEADWLKDVNAASAEEAVSMDPHATRAELISENSNEGKSAI